MIGPAAMICACVESRSSVAARGWSVTEPGGVPLQRLVPCRFDHSQAPDPIAGIRRLRYSSMRATAKITGDRTAICLLIRSVFNQLREVLFQSVAAVILIVIFVERVAVEINVPSSYFMMGRLSVVVFRSGRRRIVEFGCNAPHDLGCIHGYRRWIPRASVYKDFGCV